jgi:hypothetical protein
MTTVCACTVAVPYKPLPWAVPEIDQIIWEPSHANYAHDFRKMADLLFNQGSFMLGGGPCPSLSSAIEQNIARNTESKTSAATRAIHVTCPATIHLYILDGNVCFR